MLTMFAVVLAIGLLVDDAIVVVENVERLMTDEGLSPVEATRRSMDQITGALIGIATVLSAVFIPMAFLDGSTGVIYRQFSITIVSAMVLSVIVAIVLTPALCATLLKPVSQGRASFQARLFPLVQSDTSTAAAALPGHGRRACSRARRATCWSIWRWPRSWACCSCGCRPPICRTRTRDSCSCWCRRRSGATMAAHRARR